MQDLRAVKDFSGDEVARKLKILRKYLSRNGMETHSGKSNHSDAFVDLKSNECKANFENRGERSKSSAASLSLSLSLPLPLSVALDEVSGGSGGEVKETSSELVDALLLQLEHSNEALRLFMVENKRLKDLLASRSFGTKNVRRLLPAKKNAADYVYLPNGVLLLSQSTEDRLYTSNLIYYASRFKNFVDTGLESSNNQTAFGIKFSVDSFCAVVTESQTSVMVGTNPSNLELIPPQITRNFGGNKDTKYFSLLDDALLTCNGSKLVHYAFSRVLVVLRDSVTSIWTKYQQDSGYPDGLYGDAITMFDWSTWESTALDMLRNVSGVNNGQDGTSSTLWSSYHSQMIDDISASNKLIVRLEDLMFSQVCYQ